MVNIRSRAALAASALLLAVLAPSAPVHAAAVPGTACSVFPANNIWNTDISQLPLNSHSNAWLTSSNAFSDNLHPDFGGPPYGIPFNVVQSSHATSSPTFDYAGESDPGPYPWGPDLAVEQGSDAHLLAVNQDTCTLYETFATDLAGNHAGSGAVFPLASNALRPDTWTSADAAGLPILPGLVRQDEVAAGAIRHAIRFTVNSSDRSYLWPARHQAGAASDPNLPPMGARFRLKAGYDISGFSAETRTVLTAMQHYGLILADNGSDWYFTGTEDAAWDSGPYPQMIAELKTVPASQFEAVDESSLMIDPNSGQAVQPAPPPAAAFTYLFPYYDNANPNVLNDNLHFINPDPVADAHVQVWLEGTLLPTVTVVHGTGDYRAFPLGSSGGPVVVASDHRLITSQRVQYANSFNEVPGVASTSASGDLYFSWYDRISDPGFTADDVVVAVPGALAANVTVSIPGCADQGATLQPDVSQAFTCPSGFGGPVHVHADRPVTASQRVVYYATFNDVVGQPGRAATTTYSTWYDHASSFLFHADNIHVVATSGTLANDSLQVDIPGCVPSAWSFSATEWIFGCPFGQGFGGPVTVTSSGPVLVSQRVQYGSSFNEVPAQPAGGATTLWMPWYDHASSFGFAADNVHIVFTGSPSPVTVVIPGCPHQSHSQPSPAELIYSCPFGEGFSGPVKIVATTPIVASQRVQYFDSFNESPAAP